MYEGIGPGALPGLAGPPTAVVRRTERIRVGQQATRRKTSHVIGRYARRHAADALPECRQEVEKRRERMWETTEKRWRLTGAQASAGECKCQSDLK